MRDLTDLAHGFLENPVRRGICDHAGRKLVARRLRLGAEIFQVDVAVLGRGHHDNLHPAHLGAGRVGAMRGDRNQADISLILATRPVIGGDGQKSGILALRARVRLHRHCVIAGDRAELG